MLQLTKITPRITPKIPDPATAKSTNCEGSKELSESTGLLFLGKYNFLYNQNQLVIQRQDNYNNVS